MIARRSTLAIAAALFLATGTAHAEDRLAPDYFDPPECKQFTHEEFRACINRLWAARPEPTAHPELEYSYMDHWKIEKWECALTWMPLPHDDANSEASIGVKDLPKIIKRFKEMKGHCAFLKCLDDRAAGKVKHCYYNDKRWR